LGQISLVPLREFPLAPAFQAHWNILIATFTTRSSTQAIRGRINGKLRIAGSSTSSSTMRWRVSSRIFSSPRDFLAKKYRDAIGLESTPLPDPIFETMVNPSIDQGLFFFARLAGMLVGPGGGWRSRQCAGTWASSGW
jgi:hypothetical protein